MQEEYPSATLRLTTLSFNPSPRQINSTFPHERFELVGW